MATISIAVFMLVIISSFFHALWNFFARRIKGNMGVIYLGTFTATFSILPVVIVINILKPPFLGVHWELDAILFIFLTSSAHSLYFCFLGAAYKYGEISVVYPVARGTGVGLTSLIAAIFLKEVISWMGWIGIWSIVIGVLLLGLGKDIKKLSQRLLNTKMKIKNVDSEENLLGEKDLEELQDIEQSQDENKLEESQQEMIETRGEDLIETPVEPTPSIWKTFGLAIAVGVSISFYSICDKQGVSSMDPITYSFFRSLFTGIFMTPYIYWKHREQCVDSFKNLKRYIFLVGIISFGAYLAILFAFQLVNASYIVAIREVSVVFGSLLGFFVLKEEVNLFKVLGIIAILIGLVLVKLAS